jgi:hypothetical protein
LSITGRALTFVGAAVAALGLFYGEENWNLTDDRGTVVMNQEQTAPDLLQGDWVWPEYPGPVMMSQNQ